jgi:hypothetical protein
VRFSRSWKIVEHFTTAAPVKVRHDQLTPDDRRTLTSTLRFESKRDALKQDTTSLGSPRLAGLYWHCQRQCSGRNNRAGLQRWVMRVSIKQWRKASSGLSSTSAPPPAFAHGLHKLQLCAPDNSLAATDSSMRNPAPYRNGYAVHSFRSDSP